MSCGKRSSGTIFNLVFRGWAHVLYGTNLPGASHMSNLTLVFDERRHAFRAYRVAKENPTFACWPIDTRFAQKKFTWHKTNHNLTADDRHAFRAGKVYPVKANWPLGDGHASRSKIDFHSAAA